MAVAARPGEETATFDLGSVRASVSLAAGPRIVGYARTDGPQLFAQLPDEVIAHPAIGIFSFLGGHRLWRAPEVPEVTYQSDAGNVAIEPHDDGIRIFGSGDTDGIVKVISLHQRGRLTVVDHALRHEGSRPIRCAAWAITQLAPGGTAVLPQSLSPVDVDGVLPNRSIAVWPYTDLSAPEIEFRSDSIRVAASRRTTKLKFGQENRCGWIAYVLGDELFVKWAPLHRDDLDYADLGSSVECYRDHRFLELESLGPLTDLLPEQEIRHREVWMLTRLDSAPLDDVLDSLPLDPLVTVA